MGEGRRSRALRERAGRVLPGGVSSNVRSTAVPHPLFFARASGPYLYDVDGRELIDYVLGQGPMLLGHSPPEVYDRLHRELKRGQLFGGQHELEVELAERLVALWPCADMVRFSNSGSEAVHAALRLTRAYTRRRRIVKFEGHYHGWLDGVLLSVSPDREAAGERDSPRAVSESAGQELSDSQILVLPWNDLGLLRAAFEQWGEEIAAVVLEPVMCNAGVIPPADGYLEGVRALCDHWGALLVFDEIITGFRLGLRGAQGCFGVVPDLAVFGKALASGLPLSCLAGRATVMEAIAFGRVNHSGTFNANIACVAAALATLDVLEAGQGRMAEAERRGGQLMEGLRRLGAARDLPLLVQGYGLVFYVARGPDRALREYRDLWACDHRWTRRFLTALLDEGIHVTSRGLWYLSLVHSDGDVDRTLAAAERALERLGGEGP